MKNDVSGTKSLRTAGPPALRRPLGDRIAAGCGGVLFVLFALLLVGVGFAEDQGARRVRSWCVAVAVLGAAWSTLGYAVRRKPRIGLVSPVLVFGGLLGCGVCTLLV